MDEVMDLRFEVEEVPPSVLLVLDRKCSSTLISAADAFYLAGTIEIVLKDVKTFLPRVEDRAVVLREQAQVRLNHHDGMVLLLTEWTDRIRFTSGTALYLVSRALRRVAQDAILAKKGTRLVYGDDGMVRKVITRDGVRNVR